MKRLEAYSVLGAILLTFVLCAGGCGGGGGFIPIGPEVNLYIHTYPGLYDKYAPPPAEITLTVETYKGVSQNCTIDWGEHIGSVPLTSLRPTHVYTKRGQYFIWINQQLNDGRIFSASAEIQIGLRKEKYQDAVKGSIAVLDREVNVYFLDYERYSGMEGNLVDDPEVAAFIAAENLTVISEWKYVGDLRVELPEGTSIEEVVVDWVSRYPGLIQAVMPIEVVDYSHMVIL
jgi:hypothetical protein